MYSSLRTSLFVSTAVLAVGLSAMAPLPSASASIFVTSTIQIPSSEARRPGPFGVAVESGTNQAFVTNNVNDTVSVIDTTTHRVIATIPHGPSSVGEGPGGIAIDLSRQAFVANYDAGTLSVIDTNSKAVIKVIAHGAAGIGAGPAGVAVDDGVHRAYVANKLDGTVSVIDTESNTVVSVLRHDSASSIGGKPVGVAVDTALHKAYVTNELDGTVSVIDTTSDSVVAVLAHDDVHGIGTFPRPVAVDSGTHRAFVMNTQTGTVSVIDTTSDTVEAVLPGTGPGSDVVAVDSASHQAFFLNASRIVVIDTTRLAITRVIANGPGSEYGGGQFQSAATDPEHGQAFISSYNDDTVSVIDTQRTSPVVRRGGADRFAVSVANSASEFTPGSPVAYIASGGAFADALSGGAAAGAMKGPVLLVERDSLPAVIESELRRLKPARIVILGGLASVGDSVERQLMNYAPAVSRLGGADRYIVSAAISRDTFAPRPSVVYVASGAVFPDALSGSAVAARLGAPVLLVTHDSVPRAIEDELARLQPGSIVVLGGPHTVSPATEATLAKSAPTSRITGSDRFDVSADISRSAFPANTSIVYIASGAVFPDALSGAPVAAQNAAPVLLITSESIPLSVSRELERLNPAQIVVLGGSRTLSDTVVRQLHLYLR